VRNRVISRTVKRVLASIECDSTVYQTYRKKSFWCL